MRWSSLIGLVALIGSAPSCARPPAPLGAPHVDTVFVRPTTSASIGTPRVLVDTAAWVDSTLASLTLRQRVAQMVTFWLLGDYTSLGDSVFSEVRDWVEREGVGGVVMSLGTPIEVADKVNYLQRHSRIPLLVSADLEPELMRLESAIYPSYLLETGGATTFPRQMAIAATGREQDAYEVGKAIAEEGRASGIQVNYAPVVDVNINPNNPVIGTRSFGEDPATVARLSVQFIRGTHDGGMLATAKHFPGHGDTDVDSHVGLPVIRADIPRLDAVELVPFKAAIDQAGVDLVMSAHIALPAIGGDSLTPATLRPDIMHALLRDSLHFRGIAITDALSMQGVGKGYHIEESVVRAIKAGSDILLRPAESDQRSNEVVRAVDAVVAAVERGDLTSARIDESVRRILWTKARVGLVTRRLVSTDSLRAVVASPAHRALAQDVAQRALTLIRDEQSAVPLQTGSVAVVEYMPETELKAGRAFMKELAVVQPGARLAGKLLPNAAASQMDSVGRMLRDANTVILAVFVRRVEGAGRTTVPPRVAAWIDSVAAARRSVVVSFGNPYLIQQFPRARAYLNTYSVSDPSEIAVARALAGKQPIAGKSPVSLPGFFKRGDGITR